MATHTPGPWTWDIENEIADLLSPTGMVLLAIDENAGCGEMPNEPNARLIAAAPEMLEALKRMSALMNNLQTAVPWAKTFDLDVRLLNEAPLEAKRAITKAEGQ